ncbi:hypothetical protein EJ05DRAFT_57183 [Pseudovirgaria hyperparasitica]|uniref:Uncharacterized protein n=1 Tax=Pseudovirgaria hyperparasitica TaxID=470096 RepID=A0A6A6W3H3_9PEZI|nr:uncharacterized protein EJ05DRAFT_57183 [Pseudovirgaria hyperparasitica]KAF2757153.1 hypothetical protein EJ05DRAFT_57183 [Pseudovirgaria hyperparasitica]
MLGNSVNIYSCACRSANKGCAQNRFIDSRRPRTFTSYNQPHEVSRIDVHVIRCLGWIDDAIGTLTTCLSVSLYATLSSSYRRRRMQHHCCSKSPSCLCMCARERCLYPSPTYHVEDDPVSWHNDYANSATASSCSHPSSWPQRYVMTSLCSLGSALATHLSIAPITFCKGRKDR